MTQTKNPWWQSARTPKQGFVMGGFWFLFAVVQLVEAINEPKVLSVFLTVLAAALSVVYLVSAVLLRRRQRSAEDESGREAEILPD